MDSCGRLELIEPEDGEDLVITLRSLNDVRVGLDAARTEDRDGNGIMRKIALPQIGCVPEEEEPGPLPGFFVFDPGMGNVSHSC